MTEGRIRVDLPTGWQLIVYDLIDSTSVEAKRLAITAGGVRNGVLVIQAAAQTDGRGRDARTWYSPAGNLHFSVLFLKPPLQPAQFPLASFLASVAVVEGIAATVPALQHKLACKWPNDVLCNGRKLCGILSEGECQGDRPVWLLIGIGLNVVWAPESATVQHPATSLFAEGVKVSINVLLSAICHQLANFLTLLQTEGFLPVRRMWLARAVGRGRTITVRTHHNTNRYTNLSGIFLGIDHDGALLLKMTGGFQQKIISGEILSQRDSLVIREL